MKPSTQELSQLREEIERIDAEIIQALRRRLERMEGVAQAKLAAARPLRDPAREEVVLQRVRKTAAEQGVDPHEVERLFRVVMEMSIARQQALVRTLDATPLRIACASASLGEAARAARLRYGPRADAALVTLCPSSVAALQLVREGQADFALVPIESTAAGGVTETYEALSGGGLSITAELFLGPGHALLALPGAHLEELQRVFGEPDAIEVCAALFREHHALVPVAEEDAPLAARRVAQAGDRSCAVLVETPCAVPGLVPIAQALGPAETTRYVEVALEAAALPVDARCKTSLVLVLEHRPGALGQVLVRLAERGVNLTKLESRPVRGEAWRYCFHLDVEGHAAAAPLVDALEAIRPLTTSLRVLGTYPRVEPPGG